MNGSKCIVFKMYETKSSLEREPVLDMNSGFAIKNHFEYIVVYKRLNTLLRFKSSLERELVLACKNSG